MGRKSEVAKKTLEEEDIPEETSDADDDTSANEESTPPAKKAAAKRSSSAKKSKKRSKSENVESQDEEDEEDNEDATPSKKSKKSTPSSSKQKKRSRKSKMNDSDQENVQTKDDNGQEKDDDESEEESPAEYEVEKIVGDRKQNGKMQYKIHWKGYSKHQDSWEYSDNLDCSDLINEYLSDKKKSKKKSEPQAVDGEWTVSRLLDMHTLKSGKREFLVRWKGFSPEDDTWEPEENVKDTAAYDRFLVKLKDAHEATPKELRVARKKTERLTYMPQAEDRKASRRNINKQRVNYAED